MNAKIVLKDNRYVDIMNIEKILEKYDSKSTPVTDFKNFFFYGAYKYSFQGENTFIVDGKDIVSVEFFE